MVKLLYSEQNYAEKIEKFGRTSTATEHREGENPEDFVRRIVKRGHLSVLRCCNATFEVVCSRSCSHQITRHKFLEFCQESQRYVKFDNGFITPETIKMDKETSLLYKNTIRRLIDTYNTLLELRIPKEDARYLLPNACLTKMCINGNYQAFVDFCCLRNQMATQWELREIAKEIFLILCKEAPAVFEYFKAQGFIEGQDFYCKKKVWE